MAGRGPGLAAAGCPAVAGRCQRHVNHQDLVTAFHLADGEPGSVVKARPRGTCARSKGDTVTSPASGPGAADLPDYAPIPQSALGPALNDQGYYVGRVERNLYWVTDGLYQSAFLATPDGVVLFDASDVVALVVEGRAERRLGDGGERVELAWHGPNH